MGSDCMKPMHCSPLRPTGGKMGKWTTEGSLEGMALPKHSQHSASRPGATWATSIAFWSK